MALPWLTVGKLVLSNLDSIVDVVKPVFTKNKSEALQNQTELLNRQIAELQAAASGNADQIQRLASQLKEVVQAVEECAAQAASARESMRRLCFVSLAMSFVCLLAVSFLALR